MGGEIYLVMKYSHDAMRHSEMTVRGLWVVRQNSLWMSQRTLRCAIGQFDDEFEDFC